MSKITNDGLTRSGTGCFVAVPMAIVGVKGLKPICSTNHFLRSLFGFMDCFVINGYWTPTGFTYLVLVFVLVSSFIFLFFWQRACYRLGWLHHYLFSPRWRSYLVWNWVL